MHCGICDAQDSIEMRTIDAQETETGMVFQMHVVFCVSCGEFGLGVAPEMAMIGFGKPRSKRLAPTWELPRAWLRPKDGRRSEAARRVEMGVD